MVNIDYRGTVSVITNLTACSCIHSTALMYYPAHASLCKSALQTG